MPADNPYLNRERMEDIIRKKLEQDPRLSKYLKTKDGALKAVLKEAVSRLIIPAEELESLVGKIKQSYSPEMMSRPVKDFGDNQEMFDLRKAYYKLMQIYNKKKPLNAKESLAKNIELVESGLAEICGEVNELRAYTSEAVDIGRHTGELLNTSGELAALYQEVRDAQKKKGELYLELFDKLAPKYGPGLHAAFFYVIDADLRKMVGNQFEKLYKAGVHRAKGQKYAKLKPERKEPSTEKKGILPDDIVAMLKMVPRKDFVGEGREQKMLRQLLQKVAEKETFPIFKRNVDDAFTAIDKTLAEEQNENIQDVYKNLKSLYKGYGEFEFEDVNDKFRDKNTGQTGVLPSLHQKIAGYHILKERQFAVLDGCGTGKTAIGCLAEPLIKKKLKKENESLPAGKQKQIFGRTVVVCLNEAKQPWKEGLAGDETKRYLKQPQNIYVATSQKKNGDFMEDINSHDWIIVNYELLPTKINGGDKTVVEALMEAGFDYLIFDEVHSARNKRLATKKGKMTYSAATRALSAYVQKNNKFLCLLSGTPMPDKMDDYAMIYHHLNPKICPDPAKFRELYENNPRTLATFISEKTLMRKSEDINNELVLDESEKFVDIPLDPAQRKIHNYLIEHRPNDWLIQTRKALLDPRLVDPAILDKIGLLGKVTIENSAKYKTLEQMLTADDGPIAKGEKVVIFSSMFKRGVTREYGESLKGASSKSKSLKKKSKSLKEKYEEMGCLKEYVGLNLQENLVKRLEKVLKQKFGENSSIAIIDGDVSAVENSKNINDRDIVIDRFRKEANVKALLCTTETGGQSIDLSAASFAVSLDEDYSPATEEQAIHRLLRPGQKKTVRHRVLRGANSIDEDITDYVDIKSQIIQIAKDGICALSKEEEEILYSDMPLEELIRRRISGTPINLAEAKIESAKVFETKHNSPKTRRKANGFFGPTNYEPTDAQIIRKWIWRDAINCWKDPAFVELYVKTLPNLSVYLTHRAKICDLIGRAQRNEIKFPAKVLSEGSGNSILYDAYNDLEQLVAASGFAKPEVVDRDSSDPMLKAGKNPNKVLGSMTGENSALKDESFDMVDNESISLLRDSREVKSCLLEANRILKKNGLLEIIVKNMQFVDEFYTGLKKLGFEVLTGKGEGFSVTKQFTKKLKEQQGEHFADAYSSKLRDTYLIVARKKSKPRNPEKVPASNFWFLTLDRVPAKVETPEEKEAREKRPLIQDQPDPFAPRQIHVDIEHV